MAKFNGTAKQAQQIQCGKCLRAKQRTANSAWQVWRNGRCLQTKQSVATLQIQHEENGAVFGRGTSLSLSLSLSLLALVARLWAKLKGFFTHFIVDFARFIAISSYFVVVFSHLFACKRHFLGHCAFLKFLNALFFGFCALFVILSLCKKATQRVARRKPQQKNPQNLRHALILWILRFLMKAQYDNAKSFWILR